MVIIFPISHEDQIIRRLPVCTIAIMVLCLLVHIFSLVRVRSDTRSILEARQNMRDYFTEHSKDLEYPDVFDRFVPSLEWEANHPESSLKTPEEREFHSLILEYLKTYENTFYYRFGFVPGHWNLGIIFYQFVHGGWLHLIINMWFLWLAGTVIEDLWGRIPFAIFYLLCGIFAAAAHAIFFSQSSIPLIGASGSIAGVMGAFLVKYFRTKIRFWWFILLAIYPRFGTFQAPASIMLILWLLWQIIYALSDPQGLLGTGFLAHIGGFVFGAAVALGLKSAGLEEKYLLSRIEKITSFSQNPYIVNAMTALEKYQWDEAERNLSILLRKEPQNTDALLLMFQLAKKKADNEAAEKYLVSLIDSHLQKKEIDLALELYRENSYQYPNLDISLASVLLLVNHFKAINDYDSAINLLQNTVRLHPDDMTGFKALSSYAELCTVMEKPAEAAKAYSALLSKRLPPEFHQYVLDKFNQIQVVLPAPDAHLKKTATEKIPMINILIKEMKILKIASDGIVIELNKEEKMLLWNRIHYLSVARIKNPSQKKPYHDYIILDLINAERDEKNLTIYRTYSFMLNLAALFPEASGSAMDKFNTLLKDITTNSGSVNLQPTKADASLFAIYDSRELYSKSIFAEIKKRL